ncbi:hypothetical protein D3C72_2080660 [compost metagenome]
MAVGGQRYVQRLLQTLFVARMRMQHGAAQGTAQFRILLPAHRLVEVADHGARLQRVALAHQGLHEAHMVFRVTEFRILGLADH